MAPNPAKKSTRWNKLPNLLKVNFFFFFFFYIWVLFQEHSRFPDSNREPLVSERKSLTTKAWNCSAVFFSLSCGEIPVQTQQQRELNYFYRSSSSALVADFDGVIMMNYFCRRVDGQWYHSGPLLEALAIANLQHAGSRIWTCWMKLCSFDNHDTTIDFNSYYGCHLQNQFIGNM